jgi:glycosyltransferase involved in cell wall biosynthesis
MVDITYVRSVAYDTTIVNVVRSLSKQYSAIFLGWNRQGIADHIKGEMLQKTFRTGLHLRFIFLDLKGPYGRNLLRGYIPMILYLPLFWSWVFINLVTYRPKVVHAFDLDTVLPCYIYKKLFRKKLIFHIVDRYAMTFIPKKFYTLYSIVNSFEEAFSKRSDILITVSDNVLKSFRKKPNTTAVILNCLEDHSNKRETAEDGILLLGYSGAIIEGRGLEQIATALMNLKNVKLYLYGPVIDKNLFQKINRLSSIEYKGFLRIHDEYLSAIINTDAIIAIYTGENPSHHVTMHNKTLEAMMGGIPIITNLSPELVKEIGFGIVVEYGNIDQIRSAITKLRDDPELRKRLGNNGRKAFLQKYNWRIMEAKLFDAYENLLKLESS